MSDKDNGNVDQDLIRDLANLLSETDISEIEIEQKGLRLRVARQMTAVSVPATVSAPASSAPASPTQAAAEINDPASHPGAVLSPMVGTIYMAPEPGAPDFISDGDIVAEGQTLMIVEAMKTMNNIPAPKAGKVTRILVSNEQPIEYGEALVIIE